MHLCAHNFNKDIRVIFFKFVFLFFVMQLYSISLYASSTSNPIATFSKEDRFYTVRPDHRECLSPACGGLFVKLVNRKMMRCPDGYRKKECYFGTVEVDIIGLSDGQLSTLNNAIDDSTVLLNAELSTSSEYGALTIRAAWLSVGQKDDGEKVNESNQGKYYSVFNSDIQCLTDPCPTFNALLLNNFRMRSFSQLDVSAVSSEDTDHFEVEQAVDSHTGLLSQGNFGVYSRHGFVFEASDFYLELKAEQNASNQCFIGGCSSHICSDDPSVVTTCEFLEHYPCYRTAVCAVQRNGECAWRIDEKLQQCLEVNSPVHGYGFNK